MDGLYWKTLLKWMIWGCHYFRKHPYIIQFNVFDHCPAQMALVWVMLMPHAECYGWAFNLSRCSCHTGSNYIIKQKRRIPNPTANTLQKSVGRDWSKNSQSESGCTCTMTRSYPHLIQENLQLRLSPRVATPQDPLSSMDQIVERLTNHNCRLGSSEFSAQLPRSWKRKPMGPLKWLGWWLVQGAALVLSSLKRQSHQTYEHHLKLETNLCYANSKYRWLEWYSKITR